jgi:3-hydroxyacyl-[acyl-carrier-protein] dehydratase
MSEPVMKKIQYGVAHHTGTTLDIYRIMQMIPHRYPFLLVDRAINVVASESAVGIKNVTFNEPHFVGHFPQKPIMPGVLIIEAMAQTAALVVMHTLGGEADGKLVYFMSIEEAKFRKPVMPGDTLEIHVQKMKCRGNVWKFACEGHVATGKAAEAMVTAMIMD